MLVVMVTWAANFIVVKAATHQIPPVSFAFLRFGTAAVTLLLVMRWREGSWGWPGRDAAAILGLGALGFGIYQMLWSVALQDIPAGDSALLVATTPVITALLAVRTRADVLTPIKLVGSLVSFAGVAVVIASGPGVAFGGAIVGDVLTLVAAVLWSIYTVFGAAVLRRHSALQTTAWAMVGGSLVMLIPGIAQGAATDWASVDASAWLGLAFSAFIPAGVANVVVFSAIRLLGPTRISAYQFLVPFIAVMLGAVVLAEPVRIGQLLGGLVIILGVIVTRSDRVSTFGGWLRGS